MRVENRTLEFEYACLFCRSGMEKHIVWELKTRWPQFDFIVPEKKRIRRKKGEAIEESVILFPGYIFMRTNEPAEPICLTCVQHVYRLLMDPGRDWRLRGADRALAEKLFETNGVIGLSTAYYDGDRIRIVDGFLKEYEGRILRVNHRKKTAQICVMIEENEMLVWLGFEVIDKVGSDPERGMAGGT